MLGYFSRQSTAAPAAATAAADAAVSASSPAMILPDQSNCVTANGKTCLFTDCQAIQLLDVGNGRLQKALNTQNWNNLATVNAFTGEFSKDADVLETQMGYNFNSRTGDALALRDVVTDYDRIFQLTLEKLKTNEYAPQFQAGCESIIRSMFYGSGSDPDLQWTMDREGLTVIIGENMIAPIRWERCIFLFLLPAKNPFSKKPMCARKMVWLPGMEQIRNSIPKPCTTRSFIWSERMTVDIMCMPALPDTAIILQRMSMLSPVQSRSISAVTMHHRTVSAVRTVFM